MTQGTSVPAGIRIFMWPYGSMRWPRLLAYVFLIATIAFLFVQLWWQALGSFAYFAGHMLWSMLIAPPRRQEAAE